MTFTHFSFSNVKICRFCSFLINADDQLINGGDVKAKAPPHM